MARPASFPRQQLAEEFRHFLPRNWKQLAGLISIEVGLTELLAIVLVVLLPRGPMLWYVLGGLHMLLLCAVPAAIAVALLANSRTAIWNLRGAIGEDRLSARNGPPVDESVAHDLLERLAAFRDR